MERKKDGNLNRRTTTSLQNQNRVLFQMVNYVPPLLPEQDKTARQEISSF
jgi:hypothetical protein